MTIPPCLLFHVRRRIVRCCSPACPRVRSIPPTDGERRSPSLAARRPLHQFDVRHERVWALTVYAGRAPALLHDPMLRTSRGRYALGRSWRREQLIGPVIDARVLIGDGGLRPPMQLGRDPCLPTSFGDDASPLACSSVHSMGKEQAGRDLRVRYALAGGGQGILRDWRSVLVCLRCLTPGSDIAPFPLLPRERLGRSFASLGTPVAWTPPSRSKVWYV